jgi:hypothetical protein
LNVTAEVLISSLQESQEVFTMTSGAWSVVKLLALSRGLVGTPCALDIWTWTLSRRAIARLTSWHQSGATVVRIAVDGSLFRRQPLYGQELARGMGDNMRAASLHAKCAGLTGPNGTVFVGGSSNLNFCRRAELLILSRDEQLTKWLSAMTDRLFAAIPPGEPARGDDARRAALLERAFPAKARPSWAAGIPVLAPDGAATLKEKQ